MAEAEVVRLFQEPATIDVFDPGTERAPKNAQAEKTVIGTLLARNKALDSVIDILQPGQFSDPLMGRIFEEIRDRLVDGVSVDVVTLADWVSGDRTFGGDQRKATQYLAGLLANSVSVSIRGYGVAIGNCALRRDLAAVANKIAALVRDPMSDVRTKVTELAAELDGAALGTDKARVASFNDAIGAAMKEATEAHVRGGPGGLPIPGFPRLAKSVVLKPQELTILGGCSGSGKSGIGFQIALNIARKIRDDRSQREVGHIVAFSLEMSRAALATRALSAASGVPATTIIRGQTTPYQMEMVQAAAVELQDLPVDILDINGLNKDEIRALLYRAKLHHGKIAMVIIDHLNLVSTSGYGDRHGMAAATAQVADSALEMAKRFDCHVLGLCQLNRKDIQARRDHRPLLSDLRYSGNFEANADSVLLMHRQIQWEPDCPPEAEPAEYEDSHRKKVSDWAFRHQDLATRAEMLVAKVRSGPAGFPIKLLFSPELTSFSEDPSVPL